MDEQPTPLAWESAGTDEPGDQNADSRIGDHSYWSLGPNSDGGYGVELIVRDANLDEVPAAGIALGHFDSEQAAKAAAQRHEDEQAHERVFDRALAALSKRAWAANHRVAWLYESKAWRLVAAEWPTAHVVQFHAETDEMDVWGVSTVEVYDEAGRRLYYDDEAVVAGTTLEVGDEWDTESLVRDALTGALDYDDDHFIYDDDKYFRLMHATDMPGPDPVEELLSRALPLLERLGDFDGNGPLDPAREGSRGQRCDLILDIKRALGTLEP